MTSGCFRSFDRAAAGVLFLVLFAACREAETPQATTTTAPVQTTDTSSPDCARKSAEQKAALATDVLAQTETFENYPATETLRGRPAAVDISSNRYARAFRTRLREEVAKHGVNFAGAYSLVSVGMTGWGDNWYIVDRRNGNVVLFPYYAAYLDFRKDSNLIVMNSKERIEAAMKEVEVDCYFLNQQEFTLLRPFYFLWKNGQVELLGPQEPEPPRNRFWDDYLPGVARGADRGSSASAPAHR